ncbi:MAG: LamG-like jellyroll fold domain-containing protein [Verrucomicrobiota bacterium]
MSPLVVGARMTAATLPLPNRPRKAVALAVLIISCSIGAQAALIGQWHLDEGSGSMTADSAGSHPGTLVNSPSWVTGIRSNALSFDGSSQYVRLNSGAILGTSPNLTIEAWIKPDNNSFYGRWEVYCEGNSSDTIIELALYNNFNGTYSPYFTICGSIGQTITAPTALACGAWHQLAAVLQNGSGGILYVDGQPVATNASMTAPSGAATETDLATFFPFGSRYFGGIIDEVQVFNTARTAAQILADYQQSNSPPPTITTQPASQTAATAGTVTLSVVASGNSALSYQWLFNGTNIVGATASSLTLTNAMLSNGGKYSVIVNDAEGSVTSSVAVVTLINIQLYAGIAISGPVGTNYEVSYRADLDNSNWITLTNLALPNSPYLFIDTTSPAINHRFYRVLEN